MSGAPPLAFAAVNRPGRPGYTAGLQRHHLIPCSLPERRCFAPLFAALPPAQAGLDDFRRNGMLLPASEVAAVRMGLPLHRGPHRDYTAMVAERLGGIEAAWSACHAGEEALAALAELQGALRRRLLDPARPVRLNRRDPLGAGVDFAALDAMAETLWRATQPQPVAVLPESSAIAA